MWLWPKVGNVPNEEGNRTLVGPLGRHTGMQQTLWYLSHLRAQGLRQTDGQVISGSAAVCCTSAGGNVVRSIVLM